MIFATTDGDSCHTSRMAHKRLFSSVRDYIGFRIPGEITFEQWESGRCVVLWVVPEPPHNAALVLGSTKFVLKRMVAIVPSNPLNVRLAFIPLSNHSVACDTPDQTDPAHLSRDTQGAWCRAAR
jgi:hypothetical protein